MRFRNIILNIGTHRLRLYMSSHDWVNDHEAETYVATFAQSAAESVLSDEDWEEDNTEVTTDIQEMPEDDFLSITLMDSHVRPVLGIYRLDDPTSSLMTLYRDFGKDMSDESQCLYFAASIGTGEDQSIDTIAIVDKDHPRESVFETAWADLQYQCRRYHSATGIAMATGAVVVSEMSNEEYEAERSDRELVLV